MMGLSEFAARIEKHVAIFSDAFAGLSRELVNAKSFEIQKEIRQQTAKELVSTRSTKLFPPTNEQIFMAKRALWERVRDSLFDEGGKMSKFYVASAYIRRAEAKKLAELIEKMGARITYKWWTKSVEMGGKPESDYTKEELALIGEIELESVKRADALVCLWDFPSMGAAIEVATALNWSIPVIFVISESKSRDALMRVPMLINKNVAIYDMSKETAFEEGLLAVLQEVYKKGWALGSSRLEIMG